MIYTIGTSNHSKEKFNYLLDRFAINLIVDVRSKPRSRFFPWFNQKSLGGWLEIKYIWAGDLLGGFGEINYKYLLEKIAPLGKNKNIALMCSEGDPCKCHRKYALSESLIDNGFTVTHILPDGKSING